MKNHSISRRACVVESLESRKLMSGTSIGLSASIPNASETSPTRAGRGEFIVKRLTGSTASALSVSYYVRSTSTATSGVDFVPLSGTVTIPVGKRSAVINLIPIDDSTVESDETVIAILSPTSLPVTHRTGTVTIHDNDVAPSGTWLDNTRHFRKAIDVPVGTTARTDQPIDNTINFTTILSGLGHSGSLVNNSIHVIEVNAAGTAVIDNAVPFQFDHDSDFSASQKASGDLVILVKGNTAANATRHYQVYFDTTGSFSAPSFTALVTTTDNVTDTGATDGAVEVQNQTADFIYQKDEGGFSHITDSHGADWISWNTTPDAGGENRGAPNLASLGFHPGRDHDITTTIVSSGPLKTTLVSTDPDGNKVQWEFYPKFARLTVLAAQADYYVLYEGTPGGAVDGNDTIVRSDDTVTGIIDNWDEPNGLGHANGEEWLYFNDSGDGTNGTSLFYVHNTKDSLEDSYFDYNTGGSMTVFGFGRTLPVVEDPSTGVGPIMTQAPNVFTIGITDGASFNSTSATIKGDYKDVTASTNGAAAVKP